MKKILMLCSLIIVIFLIVQVIGNNSQKTNNQDESNTSAFSLSYSEDMEQVSSVSSVRKMEMDETYSSSSLVIHTNEIFYEVGISNQENEIEICHLIRCDTNSNYGYIKANAKVVYEKMVGDIFSINVPGQVDVDVVITDVNEKDGIISITGHLSGYPESYYFGLSIGSNGDFYGEITTERSNYAIRTYFGETVIFEITPEMRKFDQDDY